MPTAAPRLTVASRMPATSLCQTLCRSAMHKSCLLRRSIAALPTVSLANPCWLLRQGSCNSR